MTATGSHPWYRWPSVADQPPITPPSLPAQGSMSDSPCYRQLRSAVAEKRAFLAQRVSSGLTVHSGSIRITSHHVTDLGSMGASAKAPIRCDSAVRPHLPPGSAKVPGFPGNVPDWHSVRPRV